MKKLEKLNQELYSKKISKNQQAIVNGGYWRCTGAVRTGDLSDCQDAIWVDGPAPIGF